MWIKEKRCYFIDFRSLSHETCLCAKNRLCIYCFVVPRMDLIDLLHLCTEHIVSAGMRARFISSKSNFGWTYLKFEYEIYYLKKKKNHNTCSPVIFHLYFLRKEFSWWCCIDLYWILSTPLTIKKKESLLSTIPSGDLINGDERESKLSSIMTNFFSSWHLFMNHLNYGLFIFERTYWFWNDLSFGSFSYKKLFIQFLVFFGELSSIFWVWFSCVVSLCVSVQLWESSERRWFFLFCACTLISVLSRAADMLFWTHQIILGRYRGKQSIFFFSFHKTFFFLLLKIPICKLNFSKLELKFDEIFYYEHEKKSKLYL